MFFYKPHVLKLMYSYYWYKDRYWLSKFQPTWYFHAFTLTIIDPSRPILAWTGCGMIHGLMEMINGRIQWNNPIQSH